MPTATAEAPTTRRSVKKTAAAVEGMTPKVHPRTRPANKPTEEVPVDRSVSWRKKRGKGVRHGTVSGYATDKCKCAECRGAMALYQRQRREANKGQPIPDHIKHGTVYCYSSFGCHCDACQEAQRDAARKRKARLRRLTRQ